MAFGSFPRSLTEFVTKLLVFPANNSCQLAPPDYSIALGGPVVPKPKIKPAASISKTFLLASILEPNRLRKGKPT
jgi:hypothetical protein